MNKKKVSFSRMSGRGYLALGLSTFWAVISMMPASAQTATTPPKTDTEMAADVKEIMRSVDEVKRLPITGISLVKAGDKTFLITDNGHFVVAGTTSSWICGKAS